MDPLVEQRFQAAEGRITAVEQGAIVHTIAITDLKVAQAASMTLSAEMKSDILRLEVVAKELVAELKASATTLSDKIEKALGMRNWVRDIMWGVLLVLTLVGWYAGAHSSWPIIH